MPVKKNRTKKKAPRADDDENISPIDVQYNPDIVDGLLQDIELQMEAKCSQIKKDIDFMATSVQQAFHIELIKLPNQVKQMTLRRFREEYGDSLEAVTRGAIGGKSNQTVSTAKKPLGNSTVFQTPSGSKGLNMTTPSRNPREGEVILSKNGSPLGHFSTVVKAPRDDDKGLLPQTPGIFVPLSSGQIVDMESVDSLPDDLREDAVRKMQDMMSNMQSMMQKIQKPQTKC
jgi:hypothetical protein